jgi:uncharacterized protein YndB with AHSA1/START domain
MEDYPMKFTHTDTINAPIARAFDVVNDPEQIMQWMEGVEAIIPGDPWDPDHPVGSRFTQRIREGGRVAEYQGEVLAYDKPHLLTVTMGNPQFTMTVTYRFTALDADHTRLDYEADVVMHSFVARIMGTLFAWMTRGIVKKQMAALKALAEAEAG